MRGIILCLLVLLVASHKSVKELKPEFEDDAMEHHHFHRAHRRGEAFKKHPKEKSHIDVLHNHIHEASGEARRVKSVHPKHHVGPLYSDIVIPGHKQKARHDNKGNPIPHEIADDTHHGLRHK
jgi:patatin-like phospholipase/acyl hydrolase